MERKVLTYKDIVEAETYQGKPGLFSDSFEQIATGKATHRALLHALVSVPDRGYRQFFHCTGGGKYQFFSPDPEPVEKWVPFTADDWKVLAGAWIMFKGTLPNERCRMITIINEKDVFAAQWKTYDELLANWTFTDGTPCGKKVTE